MATLSLAVRIVLIFILTIFINTKIFSQSNFPSKPDSSSFFGVEADVLYWKANEAGLSYAIERRPLRSGDATVKSPDFEWDFGFKLGLGCRSLRNAFSHDRRDVVLRLTYFHTHTDSLLHSRDQKILYPLWIQPQENPLFADEIKMHWRLHLAFIDALIGKKFFPNAHLVIHPQIGLRYAIVRQKFSLEYRGGMFTPEREENLSMKNKFGGIGPSMDLSMIWIFSRHFNLCATSGFSATYGQFYVHEAEDLMQGHRKIFGFLSVFKRLALIANGNILLCWHKIWEKSKKQLTLQVGWDAVLLMRQNHFERFFDDKSIDNSTHLGIKGFEWGIQLSF